MLSAFSVKRDVYIEIAKRYEKFIRLGVLNEGDKLPAVRVAAGELRVNPNTVQRAYALLESQGLIRSIPKKGAFVTYKGDGDESESRRRKVVKRLLELKEMGAEKELILSVIEEVYKDD